MGNQSNAILRQLGQSLALNVAIGFSTPRIDQWWVVLQIGRDKQSIWIPCL